MTPRGEWSRYATIIGATSCVMIALTFLVPWYGADFDHYAGSDLDFRVEYSAGIGTEYRGGIGEMGDLMSKVTVVLMLSVAASIIAAVLSCLSKRVSGVIAGTLSAGLLLAAGVIFYFGAIDAFPLDGFTGYTQLNRSYGVDTAPMLGWWLAMSVPAVQGTQAVVLALSRYREHAEEV